MWVPGIKPGSNLALRSIITAVFHTPRPLSLPAYELSQTVHENSNYAEAKFGRASKIFHYPELHAYLHFALKSMQEGTEGL
jgi:hypothetical protein